MTEALAIHTFIPISFHQMNESSTVRKIERFEKNLFWLITIYIRGSLYTLGT